MPEPNRKVDWRALPPGIKRALTWSIVFGFGSLLSLVAFAALAVTSFLVPVSPSYWGACFTGCLVSLSSAVGGHIDIMRGEGGITIFASSVMLFWLTYLAALVSAVFAFDRPIDLLVVSLLLVGALAVRRYAPAYWFSLLYRMKRARREQDL